jgi:hypothetical protein
MAYIKFRENLAGGSEVTYEAYTIDGCGAISLIFPYKLRK